MASDLVVGIRLTADGKDLVGELRAAKGELDRLGRGAEDAADKARKLEREAGQLESGMRQLRGALAALGVAQLAREFFQAGVELQRVQNSLRFATGSVQAAAQEYAFVRKEAERLGLELGTAALSYARLAAAAKGTSIEGRTARDIFVAVSQAAATLGISAAETEGALTAIQQIISKGTVSAEELRGQLGERLPGALQIAARAMGVTTQELGKMLEQGSLSANEFLPRFAAELMRTFGGAPTSTALQELNRLTNAWTEFKQAVADSGLLDAAAASLRGLTAVIRRATPEVQSSLSPLKELWRNLGKHWGAALVSGLAAELRLLPGPAFDLMSRLLGDQARRMVSGALSAGDEAQNARELARLPQPAAPAPARITSAGRSDAEAARERKRLLDEDARGWVAYVEQQTRQYEDALREQVRLLDEAGAERDRLLRRDAEGWVAYIEQQTRQYEEELREQVRLLDEANAERDRLLKQQAEETARTARELGLTFSSAFEDAVAGGRKLSDVLRAIEQDLIRLAARKLVTEPLANAASGFFGSLLASVFHRGGVAGESAPARAVPALAFAGAPRLHSGGIIGPGEVPAILQRGETVLPRGVTPGGVTINIINHTPAQVRTQERQERGERVIDVIIEQVTGLMGRDIARGAGIAPVLERRYGLSPAAGTLR